MRTGFSLIEVLVALALLGMLAVTSAVIFQGSLRAEQLLEADQENLVLRDRLVQEQFAGSADEPVIRRVEPSAQ